MAALISNQDGDFDPVIVDEDEYLRFPGSCKTVDWNNDNNLDVFCSLPYNLYLNNGQGGFEKLNIDKLILEVSQSNYKAEKFYSRFDFSTVGIRRNYYKDGSDALLKEKKLTTK